MIVVDTNIIAYLWFPTEFSNLAEQLLEKDDHWVSVPLWKSELRNVCLSFVKQGFVSFAEAITTMTHAEEFMSKNEYNVSSFAVLNHAHQTKCTAYDCEFVSLAESLKVPLITKDKEVLKKFPRIATSLEKYV
jgi:predicted nucleic acid-binding protein